MKKIIEFICAAFYAFCLKLHFRPTGRVVLYYHSIKKQEKKSFEKQMEYLAKHCQVIPLCRIFEGLPGSKPIIAITFDDAFVSVRDQAVPVLERLGLKASIFVPVGLLGRKPDWSLLEQAGDQEETVLDIEELRCLQERGFALYSHTLSHPFLSKLDTGRMREELVESRRRLGALLGREIEAVSYPHGDYNHTVLQEAKKAGYTLGFTVDPRMIYAQTDPMAIGRFSVSPGDGLFTFRLKAMGAYQASDWLRKMKKRLRQSKKLS